MSQIVDDLLTKRKHKLGDEDLRCFRGNPDEPDLIDIRENLRLRFEIECRIEGTKAGTQPSGRT